ncbi:MAG: cheA 1, partial [Francisellaceae bacterium]|nr:cheA 1 [Francisellaceae bacterium]
MIKDDELLNIFFEEAEDLIQSIMDFLSNWKTDIENCVYLISIQRELHTLKGGARMVNQQEIATLAHELESHYEKILQNKTPLDNLQYEKIMQEIDKLSDLIESLNPLKIINQLKEVPSELKMLNEGSGLSMQADAFEKNSTIQYETKKIEGVIRVKAQLLEEVNNTLSEVSMFHVHVGQQVSLVTTHLLEMEGVAKRLIEQLKQLDSQLETPIHNKEIKSLGFKVLDFDATDLDKFSESQQLTRMLGETTSDLLNIWENLFETKSIAESYILNQSRLINDLKMQILNTRMVPFSSILTRLNRIVRNVSLELNKKINFEVIKTDEELEKTVLERLLPCLEHMLRNSLDHGIESREKRLELGKNEIGKVTIELQRIGTDIHIDIKDDGAGINVEAVKKK